MDNSGEIELLDAKAILELELDGIKLIEASAGTGKTHTIADLYLRHILAGRLTSEILIVTYTNAATEELRGRIQNRLYQASAMLADPAIAGDEFLQLLRAHWLELSQDQQQQQLGRLHLALRSLDDASISTIHSYCQRSLQEQALAGNQLFDSELIQDDNEIWQQAARDWWRNLSYGLDRDIWQLVRDRLGVVEKLTRTLLELRNKPAARLLPGVGDDLPTLLCKPRELAAELYALAPQWRQQRSELREILIDSKALSRTVTLPYHGTRIDDWLDAADHFFDSPSAGQLFDNFQFLGSEWLQEHSKKTQRGKDPRLQHEFFQAVNPIALSWSEFADRLGPQLIVDALDKVARQVRCSKRDRAALAFQDQLNLMLEALESKSGARLAANLRRQYPVAMIDEFQDTDAIQYRIFRQIYCDEEVGSLTLIGDPKQAIYSFRGGDIFTYMQARRLPGIRHYSLGTNWRSTPELVTAVNTVFSRRNDAFIYRDSIDFHAVSANPDNARYRLQAGDSSAALTLWQLPLNPQGNQYNRDEMRGLINQAIVYEIKYLLDKHSYGGASIDGTAVQTGDIAILVRQASEGQALRQVLLEQGIRSVTIGRDSVYASDEAQGLYDLLFAISQYRDPKCAARSLASSLLQLDYLQIADIVDKDAAWQLWLEKLADLQALWERQGFIAMFQSMLQRFQINRSLAARDNSERRLTNLLHLAELLQQQSQQTRGITRLLSWFREQFEAKVTEEAELRLEDDEALVKIVTIHKSKGLQYPIVFVPFLWTCRQPKRGLPVAFHDTDLNACIDLGSADYDRHWLLGDKERLAEDLRLLYVALTRARSRVYLAWGQAGSKTATGNAGQTALAYLLHSRQDPEKLAEEKANGISEDTDFTADLERLVEAGANSIELKELPVNAGADTTAEIEPKRDAPVLATFSRAPGTPWRVNSFTALTRGVHQPSLAGASSRGDDPILEFPAGSHVGLLLHSLLENLDFQGDIETQTRSLFRRYMAQAGLSVNLEDRLCQWMDNILRTPIDGDALTLDKISRQRRLPELVFDFALNRIDVDALNAFMQSFSNAPLQNLSSGDFRGMITGVIDLVFEYDGRYYLADYKSNYLGSELADYNPLRLQQAMLERRYDLQSMLYVLALHRLLRLRVPGYDYERHFGGSYYLFLRAMRPQNGNRYGVHFERPTNDAIKQFDALFEYSATREMAS